MTATTSLVMNQRQRQSRSGDKMCDDHPHYYSNLIYLMSCNKGGPDSHLVPDEDDFRFTDDHNHHHHQVAPKVTKAHLFDLNRDLDDDTALSTIVMINSKTEEDADEDVVVPHDSRLPASNQPPPHEADPPALVPSLSVCSNHLPCDQGGDEQVSERTLTSTPPKRNKAPPTTNKRRRRAKVDKKLKALQGLIPNCTHKADRASILDEAIVYVKTLQLQLQMMTMPFPMIGIPPPFIAPPLILPHHHHPFPTFPCIQSSTHLPASANYNVNSI